MQTMIDASLRRLANADFKFTSINAFIFIHLAAAELNVQGFEDLFGNP